MRWIRIALISVLGLAFLAVLIGMLRPASHTARTQAAYRVPPEEVWAVIADFDRWSEWNPEIERVERLPDREGRTALRVTGTWGDATSEVTVEEPPSRMVTAMDAGSFRGRWTYELAAAGDGTLLTITEEGEVGNPLLRTMMLFHDDHATMMAFHRALASRLGVGTEPVRIDGVAR
jgi:uncharacterized protein YndB with AHSA1/START domain